MNYIIAIGVFQSMIALAIIRASKKKRPADNLLLWLTVCIFVHLFIKFLIFTVVPFEEVRRGLNTFIGFAYGPLLWMFAKKLKDDKYIPFKHWYIFVPTLLAGVCYMGIVLHIMATGNVPHKAITLYNEVTQWSMTSFSFIFPLAAFLTARKLSDFWEVERKLIYSISALFMSFTILPVLCPRLPHLLSLDIEHTTIIVRSVVYAILLTVTLLIFKYRLSLQTVLEEVKNITEPETDIAELPVAILPVAAVEETPQPERKSVLTSGQQANIIQKLEKLMAEKKLYKDDELTLEKLAATMQISRHHISEALNQYLSKTFYQFINEFRVQEIIATLNKCRTQEITPNILALAMEAGFKSKSSFNLYFKKYTGLTPTEYLKTGLETPKNDAGFSIAFSG